MGSRRKRRAKRAKKRSGRKGNGDAERKDVSTGLADRQTLEFFLDRQFAAAMRGSAFVVVMIGLSGVSKYAEEHGRKAANRLRRRAARTFASTTRYMDVCGRFSTDVYLVIIPGEASESGEIVAQRVCRALEEQLASEGDLLGVAAGVAAYESGMAEPADLVARVEAALEVATQPGAGQVHVVTPLSQGGRSRAVDPTPVGSPANAF